MRNRETPFPSAAQAGLLYIALLLCEQVISYALRDARSLLGLSQDQLDALTVLLANACMFALVTHFQNITYRTLFHDSRSSIKATMLLVVPPVLLLVPALLLAVGLVQNLLVKIFPLSAWEEQLFSWVGSNNVATVVLVCVLAPVLEEMLFRGIVLRGFLHRYGRPTAIFGSAVIFGAAHLNMYQFVVGFLMGSILGWLYERTRSLIPCIALHAAYNCGAVGLWGERGDVDTFNATVSRWALALVAAACGALLLRKMLGSRKSSS